MVRELWWNFRCLVFIVDLRRIPAQYNDDTNVIRCQFWCASIFMCRMWSRTRWIFSKQTDRSGLKMNRRGISDMFASDAKNTRRPWKDKIRYNRIWNNSLASTKKLRMFTVLRHGRTDRHCIVDRAYRSQWWSIKTRLLWANSNDIVGLCSCWLIITDYLWQRSAESKYGQNVRASDWPLQPTVRLMQSCYCHREWS